MITITIKNVKPKTTGETIDKRVSAYLSWKRSEARNVRNQLPLSWEPLKRVEGVIARITIPIRSVGHPPDIYNLIGGVADVLTMGGIWVDDSSTVSDLVHMKISRNQSGLSTVILCETVEEYKEELKKIIDIL